jgi:hypothetical protein
MTDFVYPGSELEVFDKAVHWKRYFASHIAPYIRGDVLEVGSGLGVNLKFFSHLSFHSWTRLEPDRDLAARSQAIHGTLADIPETQHYDTILYIDVLEHIQDDSAELVRAVARLNPGGCLIVLAPAHPWLFSAFDAAIGHFRRYTKASLAAAVPPGMQCEKRIHLDCAGLIASAANRFVFKRASPTRGQIWFWDYALIPISRVIDPLFAHRVGKSVLGVWRKPV